MQKFDYRLLILKGRIKIVGRRRVAVEAGMPYYTLSAKLGGFCPFPEDERKKIELVLKCIEAESVTG